MDLKQQLLQNEIQNMGQIIQTLSFELVVLQDFIAEEFGPRFLAYRQKYSSKNVQTPTFPTYVPTTASSSAGPTARRVHENRTPKCDSSVARPMKLEQTDSRPVEFESVSHLADVELNETSNNNESNLGDPLSEPGELFLGHVGLDHDQDEDSDTLEHLKDPLDDGRRKGGRRKMKVWMYFDKVNLNGDKVAARCQKCSQLVSSRAARMIEHHLKCSRLKKHGGARGYMAEIRNEMAKLKTEQQCPPDPSKKKENAKTESTPAQNVVIDKYPKKTGRAQDPIWTYYTVVTHNGLRKAKCMECGEYISPKADRLRHHKATCEEAEKTGNTEPEPYNVIEENENST